MRTWAVIGLAISLLTAAPTLAQSLNASDGEAFLKAVEQGDASKALPLAQQPGSRVVNYRGYSGNTALHIAVRNRELNWVGFLLKNKADPDIGDSKGDTPLILAARIGFSEAASYLIRLGAKVDAANKRGETALIVGVQQKRLQLVELLLKSGANPDKSDFAAGYSARDYARRETRNPELLRLIETVKSTTKPAAGPKLN
ncbi:MAG TPA: ankyrin repeat domain-containing protein [Sphingomicrobium sp.]|nr:ankyrin repeat domain-containing protein [Sphingomicrobium sp.]